MRRAITPATASRFRPCALEAILIGAEASEPRMQMTTLAVMSAVKDPAKALV
jgi:hypothetical protein